MALVLMAHQSLVGVLCATLLLLLVLPASQSWPDLPEAQDCGNDLCWQHNICRQTAL